MDDREHRLRQRIDDLADERDATRLHLDLLRNAVNEKPRADRPLFRTCEWCGRPCYGNACDAHRDLSISWRERS